MVHAVENGMQDWQENEYKQHVKLLPVFFEKFEEDIVLKFWKGKKTQ